MLTQLAAFVIRFRWWVIGGWALVFLLSIPFAPRVTSALKHGFGEIDTESRIALRTAAEQIGITESSVTLVFSSDSLDVDDPAYAEAVERAIAPLRQIPEVARVVTFYTVPGDTFIADDRRTTYAFVELDATVNEAVDLVEPIRDGLGDTCLREQDAPCLDVWVTGGIALFADLSVYSERDLQRAELITIPLLAVLLLIVFGSAVAAGLPVAMGLLSVVTTLALVFMVAQVTDMSIFVLNIASFLGLGMAVDYSLLMVSRFREELQRANRDVRPELADHDVRPDPADQPPVIPAHAGTREAASEAIHHDVRPELVEGRPTEPVSTVASAVTTTMQTSGKAIVFSAGTSVIALSGLLFFDFMMLRSLGVGGMTVILFSMLIALTLLPALFAVLGHRVDRLSIWRRRTARGGFWFTLSQWVMRHPIAVIVPTTAFLVLLGLPFLSVNLGSSWASLPEEAESRQGQDLVNERFGPGELSQVILVETSPVSTFSPENIAANLEFIERMESDPRVVRVDSVFAAVPRVAWEQIQQAGSGFNPASMTSFGSEDVQAAFNELVSDDLRTQMIRVVPRHSPTSNETKALVSDIRSNPPRGDMTVRLTGVTADIENTVDSMYSDFPRVIVYVVIVTYVALLLLFRSVLLPLKAVTLNALSVLASFGALVFVFQQGNFEGLLGFTAEGFTEATVPILVFAVVFGLSMDYEVFLLSRVKEEYERTGNNTRAVAIGMERSGRIITSAAAILILVSAGFATGDILIIKALGLGTAIAVLVDSTIVRALLVPALMRVMSHLNWWAPHWLRASQPSDPNSRTA